MKLSEAIRLGSMLKPQAFDDYTDGRGTCAWGAANEAVGRHTSTLDGDWEVLATQAAKVKCPECRKRRSFQFTIQHLNDDHRWAREQIADWVQTIEDAQCSEPVKTQPIEESVVG